MSLFLINKFENGIKIIHFEVFNSVAITNYSFREIY